MHYLRTNWILLIIILLASVSASCIGLSTLGMNIDTSSQTTQVSPEITATPLNCSWSWAYGEDENSRINIEGELNVLAPYFDVVDIQTRAYGEDYICDFGDRYETVDFFAMNISPRITIAITIEESQDPEILGGYIRDIIQAIDSTQTIEVRELVIIFEVDGEATLGWSSFLSTVQTQIDNEITNRELFGLGSYEISE